MVPIPRLWAQTESHCESDSVHTTVCRATYVLTVLTCTVRCAHARGPSWVVNLIQENSITITT